MAIGNTKEMCTALHCSVSLYESPKPLLVVSKLSENYSMLRPVGICHGFPLLLRISECVRGWALAPGGDRELVGKAFLFCRQQECGGNSWVTWIKC